MNGEVGKASIEEVINIRIVLPGRLAKPLVFILCLYRRLRYGYAFRRIPLTRGKYAIVDADDYYRLAKYKWHAQRGPMTFYARRSGPRQRGGKREVIWMHREIAGVPDNMFVDHINHNGLDNRKVNLRYATKAQNNSNLRRRANKGSSKYKGVAWHTRDKKWQAKINHEGNCYHLGYFDNEIAAAKAYDEAAKKYHKEFAVTNFPPAKHAENAKRNFATEHSEVTEGQK